MTHHINVQYFSVANRINSGDMKIEYRPTLDMIYDYFTKPLQGSLFQNIRDLILGKEYADVTMYNTKTLKRIK